MRIGLSSLIYKTISRHYWDIVTSCHRLLQTILQERRYKHCTKTSANKITFSQKYSEQKRADTHLPFNSTKKRSRPDNCRRSQDPSRNKETHNSPSKNAPLPYERSEHLTPHSPLNIIIQRQNNDISHSLPLNILPIQPAQYPYLPKTPHKTT
ncbi:unknown protein [Desulfotalea psychrophila LSv54]|uniref:Uncharacterized protein n=1 Tax=Desulfotalea psychrophila (strain LSv54 / DSM 12343) TaxID=177439 RepID=Q6AJJ0_DESPS|nr:unknown protein [Desulfotalea psychrophila LSv54]